VGGARDIDGGAKFESFACAGGACKAPVGAGQDLAAGRAPQPAGRRSPQGQKKRREQGKMHRGAQFSEHRGSNSLFKPYTA
jgi:hypothetical protein